MFIYLANSVMCIHLCWTLQNNVKKALEMATDHYWSVIRTGRVKDFAIILQKNQQIAFSQSSLSDDLSVLINFQSETATFTQ